MPNDKAFDLDQLHELVAVALEPVGRVALSRTSVAVRKITVHHASGAQVRVLVSTDARKSFMVSILQITDPSDLRITLFANQTYRYQLPADKPTLEKLEPVAAKVKQALDITVAAAHRC